MVGISQYWLSRNVFSFCNWIFDHQPLRAFQTRVNDNKRIVLKRDAFQANPGPKLVDETPLLCGRIGSAERTVSTGRFAWSNKTPPKWRVEEHLCMCIMQKDFVHVRVLHILIYSSSLHQHGSRKIRKMGFMIGKATVQTVFSPMSPKKLQPTAGLGVLCASRACGILNCRPLTKPQVYRVLRKHNEAVSLLCSVSKTAGHEPKACNGEYTINHPINQPFYIIPSRGTYSNRGVYYCVSTITLDGLPKKWRE